MATAQKRTSRSSSKKATKSSSPRSRSGLKTGSRAGVKSSSRQKSTATTTTGRAGRKAGGVIKRTIKKGIAELTKVGT